MPRRQGVSQAEFARQEGISKGRVDQLIKAGLPRLPDGSIDPVKGAQWVRDNLDPKRREAAKPGATEIEKLGTLAKLRAHKLHREAQLIDIELRRKQGELVDRAEVEAAIFERARFERDAWIGWAAVISSGVSAQFEVNETLVFEFIDHEIRRHLNTLAETKSWKLGDQNNE